MELRNRCLALFCFLPVAYYSMAQNASYQITAFDEDLSANVPVSGTVMASILVAGKLNHASADSLYIYVVPQKQKLNASIVSIDGKYAAELELTHNATVAGWIQVQIPTKYKQNLLAYPPDELVAYIFADGQDKFGYYIQEVFPSSWGEPQDKTKTILINSAGFVPEYSYKNFEGETVIGSCNKIVGKVTRAFNFSCDFSQKVEEQPVFIVINTTPDGIGKKFLVWSGN